MGGAACGLIGAWVVMLTIQVRWPPVLWWEFVFYQAAGVAGGLAGGGLARGLSALLRAETEAVRRTQRAASDARNADEVAEALASRLGDRRLVGVSLSAGPDEGHAAGPYARGHGFGGDELLRLAPPKDRFDEDGAAVARVRAVEGVRFALFVRLGEELGGPGLLVAAFRGPVKPGRRTRKRFVLAAPVAALSLAVGRRERDLARMEEQRRLARRMHDGQKQDLLSLPRHIGLAEKRLEEGDIAGVLESLGFAREGALRAVGETNALVREFRTAWNPSAGLHERLAQLASRVSREDGLPVDLSVSGSPRRIGGPAEEEMFWVAREALSNAVRHSGARRCEVRLVYADDVAVLTIRDDGVGFDPRAVASRAGYGLRSMKERADEFGGVVLVESSPGGGTSVLASVPSTAEGRRGGG